MYVKEYNVRILFYIEVKRNLNKKNINLYCMNSYVYYIFSIYISQKNIYAFVCCCLSWFYQTDRICIWSVYVRERSEYCKVTRVRNYYNKINNNNININKLFGKQRKIKNSIIIFKGIGEM